MTRDGQRPGPLSRALGAAGGRRAAWRRRVLRRSCAAALAAAAVAAAVTVLRPVSADPPTRAVVVASRPLAAGTVLAPGDLVLRSYPADLAPAGTVPDPAAVVGRSVAGPVGAEEVLTPARLVDPALLASLPEGTVALPLPASAASTVVVRPGLRVDGFLPGRAEPVVRGALVLSVQAGSADALGASDGSTRVVLAVTVAQAGAVFAGLDPAGGVSTITFAVHDVARP